MACPNVSIIERFSLYYGKLRDFTAGSIIEYHFGE